MRMTPRQIELARHALGLPSRDRRSYRNHFVAGTGHRDHADWMEMVANGYATRRDGADLFHLTLAGALAAVSFGETLCSEDFPHIAQAAEA